ncbi:MAG: CBS domain-containing protein [Acidocella sp.]|nr:CBS domain-containing protein [Acidocella sp.]
MPDTAADIMTKTIVQVRPSDSVAEVAATLAAHNISAAPVVDATGTLLGMVSEGDLMRQFGAKHATRRAWWLEMLAEGEDLAPDFLDYLKQEKRTAAEVMTHGAVSVTEETGIPEIADILAERRIKRVPVLRDGKLVGIVSRADIIRTLAAKAGG